MIEHTPRPVGASARPRTGPGADSPDGRDAQAVSRLPRLDSRAAAVVVTLLLLGGTLPVADGMGPASLAVAGALSVSGGLALRRPVTAAALTGGVLTLALGLGPAHIGTGILASPLAIAALAAHGRPRLAVAVALWHVASPAAAEVLRGVHLDAVLAQTIGWMTLQVTALLGGSWGRAQVQREVAERARAESELAEQRRAIARELHDTGVRAMARVVMLAESAPRDPGEQHRAPLRRISATAREGTDQLRTLLEELREEQAGPASATAPAVPSRGAPSPAVTEEVPLTEALETLRGRLAGDGFTVHLHAAGAEAIPGGSGAVVRRCLTEIEENVLRHGDREAPVAILVEIEDAPDHAPRAATTPPGLGAGVDIIVLNAVDDDRPSTLSGGHGLTGITERLAAVGGTLHTERDGRMFLTRLAIPALTDAA